MHTEDDQLLLNEAYNTLRVRTYRNRNYGVKSHQLHNN